MKKSLLSLALATLATTAFASSILFESNTKELTLTVDGSAAFDYSNAVDSSKVKNSQTGLYNKESYVGQVNKSYEFKLAPTFKYENPETFRFGFTGELTLDSETTRNRENGYLNNVRITRTDSNYSKTKTPWKVKATKAEFFASHKAFGDLVFGKTNTLVDQFAGTSLNTLDVVSRFGELPTDSKLAIVYTLPTFVEDLTLQYGYAGQQEEEGYRQNSLKVSYSKFGADFALGAIYHTTYGVETLFDKAKESKASSYDLSVVYNEVPYVSDLTVTAAYNFTKESNYTGYVVNEKTFRQSVLLDFKYEALNGLVTPYTGFEFSKTRIKDENRFTKDRSFDAYLGLESTYNLYTDVSATAYIEAQYNKMSRVLDTNARSEGKKHVRAFAAGVKVSF